MRCGFQRVFKGVADVFHRQAVALGQGFTRAELCRYLGECVAGELTPVELPREGEPAS